MNTTLKRALGLNRPKTTITTLIVIGIFYVLFPVYVIASDSMTPSMKKGDHIITSRPAIWFAELNVGDAVIVEEAPEVVPGALIRRIVALPGTSITTGQYGQNRKDVGVTSETEFLIKEGSLTVPEGFVYQAGDSIHSIHGLVPITKIQSRLLIHFSTPWQIHD